MKQFDDNLKRHEYRCDVCHSVKNELLDGMHRLVWLKANPDKMLKVCADCHHRLTREKAIEREAL